MSEAAGAGCYHCGEPLPPDAPALDVDGASRAVCCQGCAAAARFIRDAGLGDYYRLREAAPDRVGEESQDFSAWDRPELMAGQVHESDGACELTLQAEGMRCAACAWLIDRALAREPGVLEAAANAVTGRLRLRWDPARTRLSAILGRLAALGYRPGLASGREIEAARARERRSLLLRLGVAGLGAMQAMMFAEALYLDTSGEMAVATRDFFRWVALLLSVPVVFYAGWPFIAGMRRELSARRFGMDTLIATAVLLAWGGSLVETLRGGPHVWIDAAVMFVFLLLVARFAEQVARHRASAGIDALARARPVLATRLDDGDVAESIPAAALRVGDRVRVGTGESVPADGLLEEAAAFDESLLTGESRPVRHRAGDEVLAGSVCLEHPATLRLTRTGADTWLSHLVRLVERAQGERPRLARVADRVATRFVAALLLVAAGVALAWSLVDPSRAFEVTLAVLVVSCPCALSLAIPAALTVAHGRLARIGVLAADPDALETLARADILLLDKTGTLTLGQPRLLAVEPDPGMDADRAAAIAAALERDSGHPLARAFSGIAPASSASAVRVTPGLGVDGIIEGRRWRLGRPGFAAPGADDGTLWLGDGRARMARFVVEDAPRLDAAAAVAALGRLGVDTEVVSGDQAPAVAAAAARVGVERWQARQSPGDKLARLRELQARGHVVGMLGDGINDAPVLAGADVSIALAGGAPLAHRAADLVVSGEQLARVPEAIAIARRARAILRQNLAWAIGYNVLALPFAALGWVPPWLAAIGMALSSLLVTLNALRLGRGGVEAPAASTAPRLAEAS